MSVNNRSSHDVNKPGLEHIDIHREISLLKQ